MSRVRAYGCDLCGAIKPVEQIVGVMPAEDMFDRLLSFPIIMNPDKTNAHHCLQCYENMVLAPVRSQTNRKKDEPGYQAKLKELQYNIRKITVLSWREKKFFKHLD